MRIIITTILTLQSLFILAQNTAFITLATPKNETATATLVLEDVRFHPNLGIGLAETNMEPVAVVNFQETTQEKTEVSIKEPKMMHLTYAGNGMSKTWMLFVQPGDDLTVNFQGNGNIAFSGKNDAFQNFLKENFLENQYQYLPVFGYKPAQIDNKSVVQQSDSLRKLRISGYERFKSQNGTHPAFEAYVWATTATEPSLIRRMIAEKLMRRNRVTRLEPAQKRELEDYTLADFKILPDDAMLSRSYRDELRNWALIPSTRKFPVKEENRYEISPEALRDVYDFSKEKLQDFPRQKEYLLTYWLNYAATAIPTIETAKNLLADYRKTYPASANTKYITSLIAIKEKLTTGSPISDITLLDKDSTAIKTSQLKGKPLVMVFAFSLGQHEPGLKALETKYAGKATFLYISVAEAIPFGTWKKHISDRTDAKHLWASDENIEILKEKFAIDIRYPFLVADGAGKIVNRWIPQEFPMNNTLDRDIATALNK